MRFIMHIFLAIAALFTLSSAISIDKISPEAGNIIKRGVTGAKCPNGFISLGPNVAHGRIPNKGQFAACCPRNFLSVFYEDPQKLYSDWPFWTPLGHPLCCSDLDCSGWKQNAAPAKGCDKGWELVGTPGRGDNDIAVCHKIGTPDGSASKRETEQMAKREFPPSDLGTDNFPKAHDWMQPPNKENIPRDETKASGVDSPSSFSFMSRRALTGRQATGIDDSGCNPGYHTTFIQPDPLYHLSYYTCCPAGFTGGGMWENGNAKCCSDCNKKSTCTKWADGINECSYNHWAKMASGLPICKSDATSCNYKCSVNGCT